jgi:hypothetical protein
MAPYKTFKPDTLRHLYPRFWQLKLLIYDLVIERRFRVTEVSETMYYNSFWLFRLMIIRMDMGMFVMALGKIGILITFSRTYNCAVFGIWLVQMQ